MLCAVVVQNARCIALLPLPLPQSGYFGVSHNQFLTCVPAEGCVGVSDDSVNKMLAGLDAVINDFFDVHASGLVSGGAGVNSTELYNRALERAVNGSALQCGSGYEGAACGSCSLGFFRRDIYCVVCPAGARLLFVAYGLAIGAKYVGGCAWLSRVLLRGLLLWCPHTPLLRPPALRAFLEAACYRAANHE